MAETREENILEIIERDNQGKQPEPENVSNIFENILGKE